MDVKNIKTPQDLKRLNMSELDSVAEQIREMIVTTVENNGGHLSSNLGKIGRASCRERVLDRV